LTTNAAVTPAQGGTGTSTVFTAGSIPFAGASGIYTQNNAKLFWDNALFRLGIGTSAPSASLDVAGNIVTTPSGTMTSAGLLTASSGLTVTGGIVDVTGATFKGASPLVFDGATANSIKTTFAITDPTVTNKTITFPNASGTVAISASSPITLSAS